MSESSVNKPACSARRFRLPFRWAVAASLVLTGLVASATPAAATWSIVGVDPETGEVGVAIASCVSSLFLGDLESPLEPVVLVPGVGAGVSQAALNSDAPPRIAELLAGGTEPDGVMQALVDPAFDSNSEDRQHAAVTLAGEVAGFTGAANSAVALNAMGENVSAQGNILVSEAVIDDALAAFASNQGDLTARLVAALEAGSLAGGDSRCDDQTALFAQVVVAETQDAASSPSVLLSFAVEDGDGRNPVTLLVEAFDSGERQSSSGPSFLATFGPVMVGLAVVLAVLVAVVVAVRRRRR